MTTEPEAATAATTTTADEPDLAVTAAETPAAASSSGGGGGGGGSGKPKNGKESRKKDNTPEVPIEELYDLSQPIPKVDKPNKAEHDAALQEITDAVEALKVERTKVQKEIDDAMADPESKAALQTARSELNALKAQKGTLINEKKDMRNQLDQVKNQTDKIMKDKKDAKSNIKFTSLKEIDDEINKLKRKQETTTMTLNEEKKLIKEMEALQSSKKFVADLKDKDAAMEGVKEQRKTIAAKITAKDKEIDEITTKIDKIMETINSINDKEGKKRDSLQGLFKKRDAVRAQIGEKLKEKDKLRDEFRENSNVFYNYQRAIRAQKKMTYEEEKKKREEEKAAYLAKLEEEESKKIPYEEEQALCDFLADYLERTYLGVDDKNGGTEKKADVVEVKEDPFAGFKPVNKKSDDEYFGKGKGKKKRTRDTKKQDAKTGPFTLSVDTFEQFGLLGLSPPINVDQVANSVKELREKKEWYKVQPRGSVPTAADIRKANEKAAAKLRQSDNAEAEAPKKKAQGGFSLSKEEFAPLGEGAAAAIGDASSWGKNAAAAPPVPEAPAAEASS